MQKKQGARAPCYDVILADPEGSANRHHQILVKYRRNSKDLARSRASSERAVW